MKGRVESYETKAGKRWAIRYDLPPGPDGKRRQAKMRGFERKRDAERALREAIGRVERNELPSSQDMAKATVEEYLTKWIAGHPQEANTLSQYRKLADWYVFPVVESDGCARPGIGGVRLERLTPELLDELYRYLESRGRRLDHAEHSNHAKNDPRGLSPKTVRLGTRCCAGRCGMRSTATICCATPPTRPSHRP